MCLHIVKEHLKETERHGLKGSGWGDLVNYQAAASASGLGIRIEGAKKRCENT